MTERLRKYLSVLQSASYSSEFKDLTAAQLQLLCDPSKPQYTLNFIHMLDILCGDQEEGKVKKQTVAIFKGLVKSFAQVEKRSTLETMLQAVAGCKEAVLEDQLKVAINDYSNDMRTIKFKNIRLTSDIAATALMLIPAETEILISLVDNCMPLLGEKAEHETEAPTQTESKKKSKKKAVSKKSVMQEKMGVEAYLNKRTQGTSPLVLPKDLVLELKAKVKEADTETEAVYQGQLLLEDPLHQIYWTFVHKLLHDHWYTRYIASIFLRELLTLVDLRSLVPWYVCDLELSFSPHSVAQCKLSRVVPLHYDAGSLALIHADLVMRLMAGIACDQFTDYLENTIAAPVRESFGQLFTAQLNVSLGSRGEEFYGGLIKSIGNIVANSKSFWMVRYNAMLLLKFLGAYWERTNDLSRHYARIMPSLMACLNSEDEIRILACDLLSKCRALVCVHQTHYLVIIETIFANLKTADDIECSAIALLQLLEKLFNQDQTLIKDAIKHISLKHIFIFAYHKLTSVRAQAFALLFKLVRQLFGALSRVMIEGENPGLVADLHDLLQIALQGVAVEQDKQILRELKRGCLALLELIEQERLESWCISHLSFLSKLLVEDMVKDFQEFLFFNPSLCTSRGTYYSFIPEPVGASEISRAFNAKRYNLTKLYTALALRAPSVRREIVDKYLTLLDGRVLVTPNTDVAFYFVYWLVKSRTVESLALAINAANAELFIIPVESCLERSNIAAYQEIAATFARELPDFASLSVLFTDDLRTGHSDNLADVHKNLLNIYQNLKQNPGSEAKLNAAATLFFHVSRVHNRATEETGKLKVWAAVTLATAAKLGLKSVDKLNPIIKPLLTAVQSEPNPYLHTLASKALADLQFVSRANQPVNEKITQLVFSNYFEAVKKDRPNETEDNPETSPCLMRYMRHYVKIFGEDAFVYNNRLLQRHCMLSVQNYIDGHYAAVVPWVLHAELKLLHLLLDYSRKESHKAFVWTVLNAILCLVALQGSAAVVSTAEQEHKERPEPKHEDEQKEKLEQSQARTQSPTEEQERVAKVAIDAALLLKPIEQRIRTLLLVCVRLLGEEAYECVTINFIRIITQGQLQGMRLLSDFVSEIPKAYTSYLPYFILPLIRNFSAASEVSSVSYQVFANVLKILPLHNPALLCQVPNLTAQTPEAAEIQTEGREGVDFLRLFLTSEQKYVYPIQVPLKQQLRQYQQEGVAWMAFLHKYNINCALCDDMGLGKTVQALVLIANETGSYLAKHKQQPPPSLVICPSTLTKNWLYEIPKFFEDSVLRGRLYQGGGYGKEKESLAKVCENYNIVITSYERVRAEVEQLKKIEFFYIVLDEAHIVKNSKAKITQAVKQLRGQKKLILSGTPLHNNVTEIWSLFDFLNPGFLGTEAQFEQTYTRRLMTNLKKINEKIEETTDFGSALESLKQRIAPFILRRTKQDVLKDLPPKIISDRSCDPAPLQEAMLAELNEKHPLDCKPDPQQGELMLQRIQWHLYLCNHPLLLLNKSVLSPAFVDKLHHDFAFRTPDDLDIQHSGKMLALRELLEDCRILKETQRRGESGRGEEENEGPELPVADIPHRALIFCQKISMLDLIERDFLRLYPELKYVRLDSRVEKERRVDIARLFNEDTSYQLMLLTTKIGGYGLTLTGADIVIFYDHDWNPMNDLQAMDRTHRIGQKNTVFVYRLILNHTIEERLLNIQRFKQALAKSLIENEQTTSDKLNLQSMFESFVEKAEQDGAKKKPAENLSFLDEIRLKFDALDGHASDDI